MGRGSPIVKATPKPDRVAFRQNEPTWQDRPRRQHRDRIAICQNKPIAGDGSRMRAGGAWSAPMRVHFAKTNPRGRIKPEPGVAIACHLEAEATARVARQEVQHDT